jgi:hypothetical protein
LSTALFFAALFGLPAGYFAYRAVGLAGEATSYHASTTCTRADRLLSCQEEAQATVDSTSKSSGNHGSAATWWAHVSFKDPASGATRHVDLTDGGQTFLEGLFVDSPFISSLSDGDAVTAVLWKGSVVELRSGDQVMQTQDGLDHQAAFNRFLAIGLGVVGLIMTPLMWVVSPALEAEQRESHASWDEHMAHLATQPPPEFNDLSLSEVTLRPSFIRVGAVVLFFAILGGGYIWDAVFSHRDLGSVGEIGLGLLLLLPAVGIVRYALRVVLYATPDWVGVTSIDGKALRGQGCSLPRDATSALLWDKGTSGVPTLRIVPKHGQGQVDVIMAALWPRRRVAGMAQQCGVPFQRHGVEHFGAH